MCAPASPHSLSRCPQDVCKLGWLLRLSDRAAKCLWLPRFAPPRSAARLHGTLVAKLRATRARHLGQHSSGGRADQEVRSVPTRLIFSQQLFAISFSKKKNPGPTPRQKSAEVARHDSASRVGRALFRVSRKALTSDRDDRPQQLHQRPRGPQHSEDDDHDRRPCHGKRLRHRTQVECG